MIGINQKQLQVNILRTVLRARKFFTPNRSRVHDWDGCEPFPWSCVGNSNVEKWFKLKALQNDENILRYGAALTSSKLAVVLAVTSL